MLLKYEEEILTRMYNYEIIGNKYRSIQIIERQISWRKLQVEFKVRKKFVSIMQKLKNKGYVDDHGKSGSVYALTEFGVYYVLGLRENS